MSVAPVMQLDILTKMERAATKDLIVATCCYKTCKKAAAFLLILRYRDGSTDVYGLCREDKGRMQDQKPLEFEKPQRQGVFLYP